MKRPLLMVAIGYIIGIIEGLYLHISIVPLYVFIATIYILIYVIFRTKKSKLWKITRYFRYIKLYINRKSIIIILLASLVSNITINKLEARYTKLQEQLSSSEEVALVGMIASPVTDKEYEQVYTLKIDKAVLPSNKKDIKNLNVYIHYKGKNKENYKYGDIVEVKGKFEMPEEQRNYGGFDYKMYLKTQNVLGNVKVNVITKYKQKKLNIIEKIQEKADFTSNVLQERIKKILPKDISSILIGLLLGNTTYIEEDVINNFRSANISHVLAVSGMHMSYVILISMAIFKNPFGKKKAYILSILLICSYMFITGFSPSIVRAGIMGILFIISKLIYKSSDVFTNISIAGLIIMLYNPYIILNLGFQLSFGGTIGIVLFNKFISKILGKFLKGKILDIISVTLSAQTVILPISIYHFNIISPYFIITNLLIGITIGPIMTCSFAFMFLILINTKIAKMFSIIVQIPIRVLIWISKFGRLPFSNIYIATPTVLQIIIYFILLINFAFIYYIYTSKHETSTIVRFKNVISLIKFKIKYRLSKKAKRITIGITIFIISFLLIFALIPKDLKIHFVDVGQGDCTFIETPRGKTILIDGGGMETYDVGKNTLIPYILDRGYTHIDIAIISHFDSDHVDALFTTMEKLKVKEIFIGKQFEKSENLNRFLKLAKEKNVKICVLEAGNKIKIESDLYLDVLWPDKTDVVQEKVLNNNALVFKLCYKSFSMLFTGDIEALAEQELIKKYNNLNNIKSTILKVAHHGSKSSSTEEFIRIVNPKIAVIGVGKNNLYGHPSEEVIKRLKDFGIKIYRTDLNGEVSLCVDRDGKIKSSFK